MASFTVHLHFSVVFFVVKKGGSGEMRILYHFNEFSSLYQYFRSLSEFRKFDYKQARPHTKIAFFIQITFYFY
jgi:hypothetical protein